MLFSNSSVFERARDQLAYQLSAAPACIQDPLPCDRWIARSVLQKAIRRGEAELALRALANLYQHDSYAVWRHLTIICLEDIGIGNIDLLAQIVAAKSDRKWRVIMGGDWAVFAALVGSMAASVHCQAACDLLLRVTNDPVLEAAKGNLIDRDADELSEVIADDSQPLLDRAMTVLAMSGQLLKGQQKGDIEGAFDLLAAEIDPRDICVSVCRSAWKISRNPMALLLPLVWQLWMECDHSDVVDDPISIDRSSAIVPGYALDQFTRVGNRVSRAYLSEDERLRELLGRTGIPSAVFPKVLGDMLFLIDGGRVLRRLRWNVGDILRLPYRCLPSVPACGNHFPEILAHCQAKARQIAIVRKRLYSSSS